MDILEVFRANIVKNQINTESDFIAFRNALYQKGIGLEETLKFLYFTLPSLEEFKNYIADNYVVKIENELVVDVLTTDDLEFWDKNGYVVIKNSISKDDCSKTQNAIFSFLNASPHKSETWYKSIDTIEGLMVLFTKHETLKKNRNSLIIKKAYQQLYGTKEIVQVVDKVSFNPPENANYKFRGSSLHWDMNLKPPFNFVLQGLLYLTDVKEHGGAFHCVPGFHHSLEKWLKEVPINENPCEYALKTLKLEPVVGQMGDFIIWHHFLPHCATPNKDINPRLVQYFSYLPILENEGSKDWI